MFEKIHTYRFNQILLFLSILVIISSCSLKLEDVDFNGVDSFKIEKIENKLLNLRLGVSIDNPSSFSIKVKSFETDLFLDDRLVGHAKLNEKVKVDRKKEDVYSVPIQLQLEDGAYLVLLKTALKDKVNLHLVGFVKGSIMGISKRIKIDETQSIDGKNFKFDSGQK